MRMNPGPSRRDDALEPVSFTHASFRPEAPRKDVSLSPSSFDTIGTAEKKPNECVLL
jgi:hypothetical protein